MSTAGLFNLDLVLSKYVRTPKGASPTPEQLKQWERDAGQGMEGLGPLDIDLPLVGTEEVDAAGVIHNQWLHDVTTIQEGKVSQEALDAARDRLVARIGYRVFGEGRRQALTERIVLALAHGQRGNQAQAAKYAGFIEAFIYAARPVPVRFKGQNQQIAPIALAPGIFWVWLVTKAKYWADHSLDDDSPQIQLSGTVGKDARGEIWDIDPQNRPDKSWNPDEKKKDATIERGTSGDDRGSALLETHGDRRIAHADADAFQRALSEPLNKAIADDEAHRTQLTVLSFLRSLTDGRRRYVTAWLELARAGQDPSYKNLAQRLKVPLGTVKGTWSRVRQDAIKFGLLPPAFD